MMTTATRITLLLLTTVMLFACVGNAPAPDAPVEDDVDRETRDEDKSKLEENQDNSVVEQAEPVAGQIEQAEPVAGKDNKNEPDQRIIKRVGMEKMDPGNRLIGNQLTDEVYVPKEILKTFKPIAGEYITIKFESITKTQNGVGVNFTITNTKPNPQRIFLTDVRLVNRSKKTVKKSDVGNKWAIPGEHEQFIFNDRIAGWEHKNGLNYKILGAGQSDALTLKIVGNPEFDKHYYRLSITCNNENFVIIDPTI